jgi:phage host-nuclease inhibitor protein Gam
VAKTKKAKTKAVVWAPQTREDVVKGIEELGQQQRNRAALETLMNNEIAEIQARYAEQAQPITQRMEELQTGIAIWCEAHRDELTSEGKTKTHDFGSGTVSWRLTPWSVALQGVEDLLKRLRRLRLTKYIRTKYEVNKQKLLEDREELMKRNVDGITFKQTEEFIIAPIETTVDKEV